MSCDLAIVVTDLGPGDGGKGGVIQKVCIETDAHTIIKLGGGMGSHGVRTSRGQNYNFSYWGCGTFEGVHTHISRKMAIDPLALLREGNKLKYEFGISDIFDYLTVDENALCSTPFHFLASRLQELGRKENRRGTIGTGIGEAVQDSELFPDLAIRVKDLGSPNLREKLQTVRLQKITDLEKVLTGTFLKEDQELAIEMIATLTSSHFVDSVCNEYREVSRAIRTVDRDYLKKEILSRDGMVVFEGSHGILTDKYYGFHPHTTKLRTVPQVSLDLLKESGYGGRVVKLGVTRAYQIRHGAGPMVTEDPEMVEKMLPGSSKDENRWQGKIRVGPLDLVALRYAIDVCGGPDFFDGLAITWFDQIQTLKEWRICEKYTETGNQRFFSSTSRINVRRGEDVEQLDYQERLGKILRGCRPIIQSFKLADDSNRESLTNLCCDLMQNRLGIPVKMISFGPTEDDKICL